MTEQLHFHFSLSCTGEGNGNPRQCSCLENPRDGGAWWTAVYGVSQSRTDWCDLAALAAAVMLRYHSRHRLVPLLWSSWFHVFQPLSFWSLFNDHHGISSQKNHPHFYSHSLLTQPRECLVPAPGAIQKVWGLSPLASGPSQPQALTGFPITFRLDTGIVFQTATTGTGKYSSEMCGS